MMRRFYNNFRHHANWYAYYINKYFGDKKSDFTFIGRGGMRVLVPNRLISTYKECFFDETYFKPFPKRWIAENLKTVVDIGANVGYFSLSVFATDNNATVYAYEPMPNNFALLQKYRNENSKFRFNVINKAVGNQVETITLHYDIQDSFTTAASIFESENQPDKMEMETITLANLIAENKIDKIDFLKLDCEGSEYSILYSASPSVLNKISIIAVETHIGRGEHENVDSLAAFLEKNNFQIKVKRSKIWGWKLPSSKILND